MAAQRVEKYPRETLLTMLQTKVAKLREARQKEKEQLRGQAIENLTLLKKNIEAFLESKSDEDWQAVLRADNGPNYPYYHRHGLELDKAVEFVESYPLAEISLTMREYADLMNGHVPQ